ncbi:MAG: hypothetical protein JW982_09035 [Spirochaetes bacterium]|nr:hypothetical protein [Spirochaetota bacterium]
MLKAIKFVFTVNSVFMLIMCSSGNIKFPDNTGSEPPAVSVYISSSVNPGYECSSSLLGISPCYSCRENIENVYRGINAAVFINDAFEKRKHELQSKMKFENTVTELKNRKSINVTEQPGVLKVLNEVNTPYLLEIDLSEWGFVFFKGRPCIETRFKAALYDVSSGKTFWEFKRKRMYFYDRNVKIQNVDEQNTVYMMRKISESIINEIFEDINSSEDENDNK